MEKQCAFCAEGIRFLNTGYIKVVNQKVKVCAVFKVSFRLILGLKNYSYRISWN
jgi:hypothetical protein